MSDVNTSSTATTTAESLEGAGPAVGVPLLPGVRGPRWLGVLDGFDVVPNAAGSLRLVLTGLVEAVLVYQPASRRSAHLVAEV